MLGSTEHQQLHHSELLTPLRSKWTLNTSASKSSLGKREGLQWVTFWHLYYSVCHGSKLSRCRATPFSSNGVASVTRHIHSEKSKITGFCYEELDEWQVSWLRSLHDPNTFVYMSLCVLLFFAYGVVLTAPTRNRGHWVIQTVYYVYERSRLIRTVYNCDEDWKCVLTNCIISTEKLYPECKI